MAIVGCESAIYLVMNNPQHIGMGALSQEPHEGLNGDGKRFCSTNNVPNYNWVPNMADFYDIKLILAMAENVINWKDKEQIHDNQKCLIYQKGVSDINWKNAVHQGMSGTAKLFMIEIDKIKCGDTELPPMIKNQMNKGQSPLYEQIAQQIYEQLIYVNSGSVENFQSDLIDDSVNSSVRRRSPNRRDFLRMVQSQSQIE